MDLHIQPLEEIAADERWRYVRGTFDGRPVLLKRPRAEPAAADRAELAREFELLATLNVEGVPRALDFLRDECALVLADPGARALAAVAAGERLPLGWALDYAIQLARILAALHRAGIVHRGVGPHSILVEHDTGRVHLTGFGDAIRDGTAGPPLATSHHASRLPYCAPETLGRGSRACDYRADYYSLGAVLYELLTGAPPFAAADALALIHGHIARQPPPPAEVVAAVPLPLSQIVMKLLAKPPEERYQSAAALEHDLRRCQREWSQQGRVLPFPIARDDVSARFAVPARLYGRGPEAALLRAAFDRVHSGAGGAELLLVAGYAGVGKTALIRDLHEHVTAHGGHFVAGKFDQLSRDVPYAALIQALHQLVLRLLAETPEQLARRRSALEAALGANTAVIAEVVPNIELVVGRKPPAPSLPPAEAHNRFVLAFQNFVAALATAEQPLAIVLDDLQWVDAATLRLLAPLLTGGGRFLLIGAYRDNEVDAAHPLAVTIAALEDAAIPVQRIALAPLDREALTQLAGDALHAPAEAPRLAALLAAKTGGNPFFVIQFLHALAAGGVIVFDAEQIAWRCDLDAAARAPITDNVVELMSRKIDALAPATRRALTLAACIGNRFELQTLAIVTGQSPDAAAGDLAEAVTVGLLLSEAGNAYVFLHDRVQQAAYARIAAADKPRVHLQIGRLLWQRRAQEARAVGVAETAGEGLFDLVSHLNIGAKLIDTRDEQLALARLNLAAGQRAKSAAAFAAALGYFTAGKALIEGDWSADYALAFALHLEAGQCEYLCGNFDRAERLLDELLPRAATALDRARVFSLRLVQFENTARYADAIAVARAGLVLFGVTLPAAEADKQAALDSEIERILSRLGDRPIATLVELPDMVDPATMMVMSLLTDAWSPAYIVGDATLARLISATLVRLSIEHGNVAESAYGYVTHAITVGCVRGDYASAWEFGNLALAVNAHFADTRRRAKILQQFHAHVNLWRQPFATCIAYAREACRSGLESGDFLYAAYGASTESWPAFLSAPDLAQFVRDLTPNLALIARLQNASFADALQLMLAWARSLQGQTVAPLSLAGSGFDEDRYVATYRDNPFFSLFHAVARLHVCYTLEDYAGALQAERAVRATSHHLIGMIWSVLADFWGGLTLAAHGVHADELAAARARLALLAESCPENYRAMYLLLAAESERVADRPLAAIESFEQAIEAADRARIVQLQALANELFARFWQRRGNRTIASLYLRAALAHYEQWGAAAKVRVLHERHGELLGTDGRAEPRVGAEVESLDVATLGKAAHAIAENVEIEALLKQMLLLAIENAGASRGALLEVRDGEPYVAAEGDAETGEVALRDVPLAAEPPPASRAIVNYALHTRASLVLADVAPDERFARDPYLAVAQPKSVLALPTLRQGDVRAVLYLENRYARDAFSPQHLDALQILAAHAAVVLESARLLKRMQQEMADRLRAEERLRAIEAGTAAVVGGNFFRALVRNLARTLQARYVFVAECLRHNGDGAVKARTRAFWSDGDFGADFEYELAGTPCRDVVEGKVCHHAADVQRLFPADPCLVAWQAQSYVGMPLLSADGQAIGHLAVLDSRPLPDPTLALAVLKVCAGRAGAELERIKAEEDLQRALAEVEQLKNRLQEENVYLRRELIANVSHDLRSPLASLRGYLDTLLIKDETLAAAERRSYLGIAVRQAEHLQTLISELFDLARLDFQGYQIDAEPVHIGELARDVLQKFQLAADEARIVLALDVHPDAGFVRADISLLERTLENLIENALAHTPAGGEVRLAVQAHDGQVTVEVADTGCGIPAADLPRVFERFYRADRARTRETKGSGLGLAIVKRIVELHGAEVRVASSAGAGTRFWFTLPAESAASAG